MDTACEGCPNMYSENNTISNVSSKNDCKCRTGDKNIAIDPGLDQAAANPGDDTAALTGKRRPESAQYQKAFKTRMLQRTKD